MKKFQTLAAVPRVALCASVAEAICIALSGGPGNFHTWISAGDSQVDEETIVATTTTNGLVSIPSNHSVDQTVEKLKRILQERGVMLFALVDHSGEAEKVGMKMPPTKLVIFGSPKAGTPLMLAAPSVAIDLPLKILVREDPEGKVWISYNSPAFLQERHDLPQELLQNIAVVETLAAKAGE